MKETLIVFTAILLGGGILFLLLDLRKQPSAAQPAHPTPDNLPSNANLPLDPRPLLPLNASQASSGITPWNSSCPECI